MCLQNQYIICIHLHVGKARRVKQAKEEATAEIETYRKEREKLFKELEQVVCNKVFGKEVVQSVTSKLKVEVNICLPL